MGFRYTELGALMNTDQFDAAASKLVDLLVDFEVKQSKAQERAIVPQTNKSAASRTLGVNYRTVSRWVSTLRDKGHDVEKQALAKLEAMAKEQQRAA